ncbi:hypothetical protein D3C81_2112360 [compost metagenome]
MSHIQESGRLIKEKNICLLGKGHSYPGALALTAGEAVNRTVMELLHSGHRNGVCDNAAVLRGHGSESFLMRVAAITNQLGYR